ncbi:MAG TPA: class I SAM-dependent methyltransferase [Anaerolineae bacterium]|nr:class I SAM-dependent methyltransferase [Anaerolineae bacterium]
MVWVWGILGVILLIGVLYWQLILAEGAYLGRRVVALLYNWSAHVYDRIKAFDPGYEQWFLGLPLSRALALCPDPLVLDVATGTARLARTLFAQPGYRGRLIGLDYSRKMLQEARRQTQMWSGRITLLWQDASQLPFPDNTFDAVTCLEALEFMPNPEGVLQEMARVLRPGGVFLITNRIGNDARWLPGRTQDTETFEKRLAQLPLEMLRSQAWQEDYDLVWGVKPGVSAPPGPRRLEDILHCPICGGALRQTTQGYHCTNQHTLPIARDGIIDMATFH